MRLPIAAALLLALAACQTAPAPPTVRSDAAPGVEFATYRTWGFHEPLSANHNGYSTIATERIKAAVEREMLRRGLVTSATPDLHVNFDVETREAVKSGGASPRVGISYGGFSSGGMGMGLGMSTGGSDVKTVTEGTLTIDVVERARNRLVWSGSAEGTLTKAAMSDPEKLINGAVHEIFERFPRPIVDTGAMTPSP